MNLHVAIDGRDVTTLTLFRTEIRQDSTDAVSTATIHYLNEFGTGSHYGTGRYGTARYAFAPREWSEVVLTDDAGVRQFAGYITSVQHVEESGNITRYVCTCSDYGILLDRTTLNRVYENQTDEDIILDAFTAAPAPITVNPANIALLVADMATFEAKDISLREMMERICDLTGGEWRVAYDGNLLYYAPGAVSAPFGLSDIPDGVTTFGHRMDAATRDFSAAANRITVLGGLAEGGAEITSLAQSAESQSKYGILSATVVDRSIPDQATADLRANAEISQRALPRINGRATTWKDGLTVGQTLSVRNAPYNINNSYVIRALNMRFIRMGAALNIGGMECRAEYDVEFGQRLPDFVTALRRLEQRPKQPTNPPVANVPPGAIAPGHFAETIEPVQIVNTLPALPDPAWSDNAVVLLTTDRKLYRRSGNTWTVYVETIDLTGQIVTTQIADDSISTPKLQALSVVAEKVAANAITAGKIAADAVIAGTIAAGAIRAEDAVFVTGAIQTADIGDATITTAKVGDAQITSAKIVSLEVEKLTGTLISGKEYQLTSTPNTMSITGADGFLQTNTTTNRRIRLRDGQIVLLNPSGNAVGTLDGNGAAIAGSPDSGAMELRDASGNWRLRTGAITEGGSSSGFVSTATGVVGGFTCDLRGGSDALAGLYIGGVIQYSRRTMKIVDSIGTTQAQISASSGSFGQLALLGSGVDAIFADGNSREIYIRNSAGSYCVRLRADPAGAGQANSGFIELRNSSNGPRVYVGTSPSDGGFVSLFGSTNADLVAGAGAGLYLGGNRVVATRGSAVSQVAGVAGSTYTTNEQTIINDLRDSLNTLIARLSASSGGHGLIA